MTALLRRVIVGGSLAVLVAGSIVYLLWHVVSAMRATLEHVAAVLSIDAGYPALEGLAALVLVVVVVGALMQIRPVHGLIVAGLAWLGDRFPFSKLVHGLEQELMGLRKTSPIKSAIVALGDHEVLAFVMEELADGRCVVFAPGSPNPSHGTVYIVSRENVHLVDADHYRVAACIFEWGVGAKKMLERARESA